MKKVYFGCLSILFLFFAVNHSNAQTDQSAPTKQDALDFINKIFKEFPPEAEYHQFSFEVYVKLDGCNLIFVHNFDSSGFDDATYLHNTSSYTIDLSSVYLKDGEIRSNVSGDMFHLNGNSSIKTRNGKVKDVTPDIKTILSALDPIVLMSFHKMDGDYGDMDFKNKNYHDRFLNAINFLIKACGGGNIKAAPVSKF